MAKLLLLISGLTLTLAWLVPNHYLPWTAFYNELLASIALLLLATATFWHRARDETIAVPQPALALLLLLLLPLLQLTFGLIIFEGDAWIASIYIAGLLLAYLTGHDLSARGATEHLSDAIAVAFIAGALISLFLAAHQWLQTDRLGIWLADLAPRGRPYANLAQPNNLATLFCLGLAAVIYLRARGQFGAAAARLLALPLLAGIALTQSRTPILILSVMAGWALWHHKRLKLNLSAAEIISGAVFFMVFWLLLPTLPDTLLLTGQSDSSPMLIERMRTDLRPVIWMQLLDAALREPLLGYGWNQVSTAQISVAADYPQSIMVEHSHSIVLDLLLWNGIIIGGSIILMLAWWLLSRIRHCPTRESWFALLAIMIVGTHGLLEFPLEYAYFLFPLGVCAGIIDYAYAAPLTRMPKWGGAGIVLLGWLTLGLVTIEYLQAEEDFRRMRFELTGLETRKSGDETARLHLLTQLPAYIRYARTEARENMTVAEIEWMGNVAHRYPHPPALFRYALALGLNHRYEEAALELKRLQRLHPPHHIKQLRQDWAMIARQYPMLNHVTLP